MSAGSNKETQDRHSFEHSKVLEADMMRLGVARVASTSLLTVTIGNSLNAGENQGTRRHAAGFFASGSDVHTANALSGSPLRFGRITPTTRSDAWGNYAYSGATLATINPDLDAQLWAPLVTAGLKPDLVVATALLENDLGGAATYAAMVRSINRFVFDTLGRFPSARLLLYTPSPTTSYSTPAIVASYQAIRDYILSLDNGSNIFVARQDAFENPFSPGTPLSGYTLDGVHPNVLGGFARARVTGSALNRISGSGVVQPYRCVSANFALVGSSAASGTNITGTWPTSCTHNGTANSSLISTANDPSWSLQYVQSAGALPDMGRANSPNVSVVGFTQVSPYVKVRIDSGADQIRLIGLAPRYYDAVPANVFNYFLQGSSSDADGVYKDGDVLTIRTVPMMLSDMAGLTGSIANVTNYLWVTRKTGGTANVLTGGTVGITVLDSGVGLVA